MALGCAPGSSLRPAFDGAFASCNPRTQVLAGAGGLVAGNPDGVAVARFGWANADTGRVLNERGSPSDRLGFVLPVCGSWQRIYWNESKRWLRPGLAVTLCTRGDFWVCFPGGALRGQRVYAGALDGTPISGYAADAELTPWSVVTSAAPGQLAIISSWSNQS